MSSLWWDDFFAVLAWIFYVMMVVAIELVGSSTSSSIQASSLINRTVKYGALAGLTEKIRLSLTHEQGLSYQKGSIVMFAAFYDLMLLTWSLKFSLLAFYARLT